MGRTVRSRKAPPGCESRVGTFDAEDTAGIPIAEMTMSPSIDTASIAPGAHLLTPRLGYTHHGIYAGDGMVIHYAGLSRSLRRAPVETVTLGEFAGGHAVWSAPESGARYVGIEVVRRAASRLGEHRYRVATNNCEHFCAWCCHGESRSEQIDKWTARLRSVWHWGARSAAAVA
jgi:hypothetical protein